MTTLLACLRTYHLSTLIRDMLQGDEALLLLQLTNFPEMKQIDWACQLRKATAEIRDVMHPLKTIQLRFPGLCLPTTLRCSKLGDRSDPIMSHGYADKLMRWLQNNDFSDLTPSEAVRVMNAWEESRKDAGAKLSDFLHQAKAKFYYSCGSNENWPWKLEYKIIVCFEYQSITGIIELQQEEIR